MFDAPQPVFNVLTNQNSYSSLKDHGFNLSEDRSLLDRYFDMRARVYTAEGMDYYDPQKPVTPYDEYPTTVFIVPTLDGEVMGGRRIVIHEPNSKTKLSTESTIPEPTIAEMLSHLPVEKMRYAELGGFCLDTEYRGRGYSKGLYKATFDVTKALKIDFLVTESVPKNIARIIAAACENGAQQVIPRPDILTIDGDEDFRLIFSMETEKKLPLRSDQDKADGLGEPLTDVIIEQLITRRQEIIENRKGK
jgi:hypothetical protein